ncbi:hypothetical protein SMMN14_09395 [Sphaerulina musiva]
MSPMLPKTAQTDVPKTDKNGEKMYTATEVQKLGELYAAQVQRRFQIAIPRAESLRRTLCYAELKATFAIFVS